MGELISSTQNPKIKSLALLKKRSNRDQNKRFIIEGVRPLSRALSSKVEIEEIYYCDELFGSEAENIQQILDDGSSQKIACTELGRKAFEKVAYREHPEGVLAVAKQWHHRLEDINLTDSPFVFVLESIEKPGNLGTILRSADATGAEAIIVCDPVTDIFNPNVIRSSTGVVFTTPVVATSNQSAVDFLKAKGIQTLGTTPTAQSFYTDVDLTQPIAVVLGNEQNGLSKFWLRNCDMPVKLPMQGVADSLNVSAAAAVVAYEVIRQRSQN